jgi:tRNA(Ile)-lysidine synthase
MHSLEKKIAKLLERENLIMPGEIVVVGVSGGPDSLALLHVLAALGRKLIAVYVDHGLRPAETGQEAQIVREHAENLKISWEIGRVDVRGIVK